MISPAQWIKRNMLGIYSEELGRPMTEAEIRVQPSVEKLPVPNCYVEYSRPSKMLKNANLIECRQPMWKNVKIRDAASPRKTPKKKSLKNTPKKKQSAEGNEIYPTFKDTKDCSKSTMFKAPKDTAKMSYDTSTRSRQSQHHQVPGPPAQVKRARSYLSDDIRSQFEVGFESSTSTSSSRATAVAQSPNSNSFVKRLVATLERRQDLRTSEDNIYNASYRQCSKDYVGELFRIRKQTDKEQIRIPHCQLERLPERENEDEEDDLQGSFGPSRQLWEDPTLLPKHMSNVTEDTPPKPTARRIIKNVLSTIIGWRGPKTLPRGSRDYYAARESLGEEMRAFRRDTMPRLIERATVTDRVQRAMPERNHQREFAEMIATSMQHLNNDFESSIATIRPVTRQQRAASYHEYMAHDEVMSGSKKVQPPAAPTRATSLLSTGSLLRPSKLKYLQLSAPQEYDNVQLRRPRVVVTSGPAPIVYDVPRLSHRIPVPQVSFNHIPSPSPRYENMSDVIGMDNRLQCTKFATGYKEQETALSN